MATIDKSTVEKVMAGLFEDDFPVKIVRYTNAWGGESYGLVTTRNHPDTYRPSEFVINPETIWTHPTNI